MTPHELNLRIQLHNEKMRQDSEERLTLAYLIAAWHPLRTRRLPNLKSLLRNRIPQTPEQMLAIVKAMNAAIGGEVRYKKKI